MDNEFGIVGYNKIKKRKYSINDIFCDTFLYITFINIILSFLLCKHTNKNF